MASQGSSRSTWNYQNTAYSYAITQLNSLGKNPNSVAVACPKEGCPFQFLLTQQLYAHIERKHPEDRRHQRDYTKYAVMFVYLF